MGCFQVRYGSSVVIYERKLFIKLATANGVTSGQSYKHFMLVNYDSIVVIYEQRLATEVERNVKTLSLTRLGEISLIWPIF